MRSVYLAKEQTLSQNTSEPGQKISVKPFGPAIVEQKHTGLFDTPNVKVKRMVLAAGQELKEHVAPGDIIVHCLEGNMEFTSGGVTTELVAGELLYLLAGELHSVKANKATSFLLTIVPVK